MSAENIDGSPPPDDPKAKTRRKSGGSDDVGRALRSAYDEALREDVPDDFLSLLGKLS